MLIWPRLCRLLIGPRLHYWERLLTILILWEHTGCNGRGQPEFAGWEGPKRLGPFYNHKEFPGHYNFGSLSPYSEQLMQLTLHTASQGKIEGTASADATYKWATAYTGRPDHAIKIFVENMDKLDKSGQWPNCGADDSQAHCFFRAVPVTILYARSTERDAKMEEAIRVDENNNVTVKFGLAAGGMDSQRRTTWKDTRRSCI
jgi:hypothetical protein